MQSIFLMISWIFLRKYRKDPMHIFCTSELSWSDLINKCPFSGYPHFYGNLHKQSMRLERVCQCPTSSYSHVYSRYYSRRNKRAVSMPFIGLSPFLPIKGTTLVVSLSCVNALSRAIPIFTGNLWIILWLYGVSMPYVGLSPFLRKSTWSCVKT